MNKVTNNKGMALVLTLTFIVIIMLLSLALFFQLSNTTQQISATEDKMEARHMAVMGIDYYTQLITSEKQNLQYLYQNKLKEKISNINNSIPNSVNIEDNDKYFNISIEKIDIVEETNFFTTTIRFESKGFSKGKDDKINSEIVIETLKPLEVEENELEIMEEDN